MLTEDQLGTLIFAAPFLILALVFFVGSHLEHREPAPAPIKITRR
jgi:hypothetical protein